MIVFEFIHAVDVDLGDPAVAEQPLLIVHPMPAEQRDRIIGADRTLMDRHIHIHHLMHPGFYPVQEILIHIDIAVHRTIIPLTDGEMNPYFPHGIMSRNIINRLHQHKINTSSVGLIADLPRRRLKLNRTV